MSARGSGLACSREQALGLFRVMTTIRMFETKAGAMFAAGLLPGFIHLSIGQEAVAAGVCGVLDPRDEITTTHRGHGHCIAKGGRVLAMMAELYGRAGGYAKGRSGSMHIADNAIGILGANAIVGGGIPMALGAAYSSRVKEDGRVAVAFFGEGAVAEGIFHEAMNLAAVWQLPIVFVCENNGYAELTPISVHLPTERVADFAAPYRIPGMTVDGNDVFAVREAAAEAVGRARGGGGPTLLECQTYRWRGHFEGDPQHYRTKAETQEWQTRDPILAVRNHLLEHEQVPEAELTNLEAALAADIEEAAREAEAMELTPIAWLLDDVYQARPQGGEE